MSSQAGSSTEHATAGSGPSGDGPSGLDPHRTPGGPVSSQAGSSTEHATAGSGPSGDGPSGFAYRIHGNQRTPYIKKKGAPGALLHRGTTTPLPLLGIRRSRNHQRGQSTSAPRSPARSYNRYRAELPDEP